MELRPGGDEDPRAPRRPRLRARGTETFIANGINADLVITATKTDPAQRHRGISLLVVEAGMEGFHRGRNLDKIGLHAQDTAELFFNDVRVPAENLLGAEGEGFRHGSTGCCSCSAGTAT